MDTRNGDIYASESPDMAVMMTIGTKSVLFGAHQFLVHPWFVALGWWKLYGFPWDPRLWVAFFVHDIGYVGKPNMDGPEGEAHPRFGARVMALLFDWRDRTFRFSDGGPIGEWGLFALLHSRYYAKSLLQQPSRLCMADKLAIALTPAWLYLPMVRATGEIHEYMAHAKHRSVGNINITEEEKRLAVSSSQVEWYAGVQSYCRRWAYAHRDGAVDTWASDARKRATLNEFGAQAEIARLREAVREYLRAEMADANAYPDEQAETTHRAMCAFEDLRAIVAQGGHE